MIKIAEFQKMQQLIIFRDTAQKAIDELEAMIDWSEEE